jgi:hypothetical protein
LLKKGGYYNDLYTAQFLEEEVAWFSWSKILKGQPSGGQRNYNDQGSNDHHEQNKEKKVYETTEKSTPKTDFVYFFEHIELVGYG